jgi:hypothetical protein
MLAGSQIDSAEVLVHWTMLVLIASIVMSLECTRALATQPDTSSSDKRSMDVHRARGIWLCCAMLHHTMLRCAICTPLNHIMPCCAAPCHAVPCCAVLCVGPEGLRGPQGFAGPPGVDGMDGAPGAKGELS